MRLKNLYFSYFLLKKILTEKALYVLDAKFKLILQVDIALLAH